MKTCGHLALVALLALGLSGCQKKAEGQVAAVVNGEEITLQEINAELGNGNFPAGADKTADRQATLQRIIQRHVLAQAARKDGLDKDAEYLLKRRALDDALLIQMLAKKIGATIRIPENRQLEAVIKDRPAMFGSRSVLTLDRIQFPTPADRAKLQLFKDAHSMDAVAATLHSQNIAFNRAPAKLDTAQIPAETLRQIEALPSGEPFILEQGSFVTAAVVTARQAVPMDNDQAKPMAARLLRNEALNKAVDQRLKSAMAEAKIEYQTGFAPPKPAKPAAAK